ncbi:MAG: ComF family protein [Syntrophobacterales bacterium]|nr:ComF family protein [Syntrophobacterales bacterium]
MAKKKNVIRWVLEKTLDYLIPRRCPSCGDIVLSEKPQFWCPSCWKEELSWIKEPFCKVCGVPFKTIHDEFAHKEGLCGECLLEPPDYDMIRSVCTYEGVIEEMIRTLKYGKHLFHVPPLVEILEEGFLKWLKDEGIELILPVPLHIERLKERGFNQSLLLAKELGKRTKIQFSHSILIKVKNTTPQVKLHKTERKKNLRRAFAISESANVHLANISSALIVDDVVTTGTTILECARVLKKAGVLKVIGLSVARTFLK